MSWLGADWFFLQQFGTGIVFRTTIDIVIIVIVLVFLHFFLFLQFVVKLYIIAELMFIVFEKRMFQDCRKRHSFFTINYKDFLEEVIELDWHVLEFIFFGHCCWNGKGRVAPSIYFRLHVMALIQGNVPLKGYSAKSIK